jgi:hypothetical protein
MTVGFLRPSEQQCITASHSQANNNIIIYENKNSQLATILSLQKGKEEKNKAGGRNVDDQNVNRPKISERRNGLFS